jgi:hypothetical protein
MNSFNQKIQFIDEFIETSTALTLERILAILLSEDTAPLLRLEYWVVVVMRHTVGILASESEKGFAILPVKSPSVIASPAAGRAVAVLAGSEVAALVDDDRVRCVEAATVSIVTESTDNVYDAPAVACVVSRLL